MISPEADVALRVALGFRTTQDWQRPGWRNFYLVGTTDKRRRALADNLEADGLMRLASTFPNGIKVYRATAAGCRAVGVNPSNVSL